MARTINGVMAAVLWAFGVAAMAQQAAQPTPPQDEAGARPAAAAHAEPKAASALAVESPPTIDESQARAIVQRADEIRFPRDGFQVDVVVTSTAGGEAQEPRRYRIYSKGSENTIIQTLEPEIERGQNLLMRGRDLWVFMPTVSQPIRLSLAQRLTGQVANGDLARASFSGDYEPKPLRTEKIDGRDHHVLELVATERSVTYPRIRYWVRAGDNHPHKAEFYALSGRLLKTCRYEKFQALGGRVRPTRLVMTDALKAGDESVLDYSALKSRDLPDRMFTKDFLKKLD